MAAFVVLIEYDISDGQSFDDAVRPMLDALRKTTPHPPVNVTAFAGDDALAVLTVLNDQGPEIRRP